MGLDNVAVVLKAPKYPENIGAAARCALNMGISQLLVVSDIEYDREKMIKMATHKAAHLIDGIGWFVSLKDALSSFHYLVGTTARIGRHRPARMPPREMAREIIPLLAHNRIALLFGPEDRGLTNDDLKLCHLVTTIPTAGFSSLNLAQAVVILCYELHGAVLAVGGGEQWAPRLASIHEMEGMYEHLERALAQIGFLSTNDPDYWMTNIRRFFGRLGLRSKEVRIIRGICRQFLWFQQKR